MECLVQKGHNDQKRNHVDSFFNVSVPSFNTCDHSEMNSHCKGINTSLFGLKMDVISGEAKETENIYQARRRGLLLLCFSLSETRSMFQ